jgi:hypothetical protein
MSKWRDAGQRKEDSVSEESGKIVASFLKNARELVCSGVDEWMGERRLFIRVYVRAVDGDDLLPTREGVTLPVEQALELHKAIQGLGDVASNDKLVACIPKSPTKELRVGCNVFKNIPLIYVRTFARTEAGSAEWFPTRQGISLRVELYPALAESMQYLMDHLAEESGRVVDIGSAGKRVSGNGEAPAVGGMEAGPGTGGEGHDEDHLVQERPPAEQEGGIDAERPILEEQLGQSIDAIPIESDSNLVARPLLAEEVEGSLVACIGLETAAQKALWAHGIVTIGDLRKVVASGHLKRLPQLEPRGISHLQALLRQMDMVVGDLDGIRHAGEGSCSLELLGLGPRARHALQRAGLRTVLEVRIAVGMDVLQSINQVGARTIEEVTSALAAFLSPPRPPILSLPALVPPATFASLVQPDVERLSDRSLAIFLARAAQPPVTLEALGDTWGITRERVRQIEAKTLRQLLPRMAHSTGRRCLVGMYSIAEGLGNHLSRDTWRKALINLELLGSFGASTGGRVVPLPDPFEVLLAILVNDAENGNTLDPPFDARMLATSGSTPLARFEALKGLTRTCLRKVSRQVAYTGGITIVDAAVLLDVDKDTACLALAGMGFEEVEEEWFGPTPESLPARSPLEYAGLKMLSVRPVIPLQDFADGLRRHISRFYPSLAPKRVLERSLRLLGFEVENEFVTGDVSRSCLSSTEAHFVQLVAEVGPVVTHGEVAECLIEAGLSLPAASALLSRSPIVRKMDQGIYALVGSRPTWDHVEAARQRIQRIGADAETTHGLDGVVRHKFNLNSWGYYSGVVTCHGLPALVGGWPIMLDGERAGVAQSDGELMWGFNDAFRQLGARLGDRVELSLDTRSRAISLQKVDSDGR